MAKDYGTFECAWCGKTNKAKHPSSFTNKYCNNKCQGDEKAHIRLQQYITEDSFFCKSKQLPLWLKTYIRKEEGKCSICGISEWGGYPIVFDIDHIDGDYRNNSRKNLRALCPNCHSQTDTYKGRNRGKGRSIIGS